MMEVTSFSEKQKTLIHWWERPETKDMDGIIADGAIRSGKTVSMLSGFLLWSQSRFSNRNFIISGVTIGAVNRNVVMPMLEIMRDWRWSYHHNKSLGCITVGTNLYWVFGGGGDGAQDKMQGMTAAGALADEAALQSKKFLNQMVGRCSVKGAKLWFNCNPESPTSFFKTDFIDMAQEKHLLYEHFAMDDNPSLSDEVKERYRRMFAGVFYDRHILGKWTKAEGMIYPMYETAFEPTYTGEALKHVVSIDYGTQNAFAALHWVFDGSIWHCVKEYRYSGRDEGHQKTDADYVNDMMVFMEDIKERPEIIVDPSATSFIAALRRNGTRSVKILKAINSVVDGIRDTATCLQSGKIKISDKCVETRKEFEGYVWDEKAGNDKPVKENDHMMDALRYFVETERVAAKKLQYIAGPY